MAAPVINFTNISDRVISDETGHSYCIINFKADQAIIAYEVRADGNRHGTGLLIEQSDAVYPGLNQYPSTSLYPDTYYASPGSELQVIIFDNDLQQDGDYRINVYACNEQGEWTPYG